MFLNSKPKALNVPRIAIKAEDGTAFKRVLLTVFGYYSQESQMVKGKRELVLLVLLEVKC